MAYDKPFENKAPYGSLFASKAKTNPLASDYYGDVVINLNEFDVVDGTVKIALSGWKKPLTNGAGTYLSLKASKPFVKGQQSVQPRPSSSPADMDDDLQF
jgi:hypothetical protein